MKWIVRPVGGRGLAGSNTEKEKCKDREGISHIPDVFAAFRRQSVHRADKEISGPLYIK